MATGYTVHRCVKFFVVDGRQQERDHWMNNVNYSPSKRRQNLVALLFNGDIYYRTLRNVGPGEELLVGYSTSFAKSLLGNPRGRGALKEEDVNIVPLHSLFLACEKCGDLFTTQYNLEMHTRRKHWRNTHGIRRCTYCTYTSSRKADIARHEHAHVDKRNSLCHVCQKRFSQPANLKVHMRIHSGDKPYECSQCGKRFRQRVHARRHEQVIHSRQYPLHCPRPPKPDVKMSRMFCFTAVMLLVLTTGACVELDESDGGYKDLRVSISENVPRDDTIIANIKTLLRSASEFLHKATYGHAIIEVPMTWPKRRSARALSSSAFYRSDVRVDMPEEQHGDKPFTKQKKSCCEAGEFIYLAPGFLATLDKSAAFGLSHSVV
ncbi:uncharacterized protein LOC144108521 [Amblyomma americanum]